MRRILAVAYGVASYMVFLAAFLYAVGFVGNLVVPKSVDSGTGGSPGRAVLVDGVLLALFAVPHSIMARPAFKQWWTRFVPPPIERSTYVLVSSLLLGLLFWQWRPIPSVIWHVSNPGGRWLLHAVFWLGWAIVLLSTFQMDHFDLFGLRQVYLLASGRPYRPIDFKTPGLYRIVRHPLMTGFLISFWAAPTLTAGHLLFAVATTAYILVALQFEERDLERFHGERYRAYRRQAGMLLPLPRLKKSGQTLAGPDADQLPIR
jgi:protein-S-isoprenylcysteine O-methyltransferase Ste14